MVLPTELVYVLAICAAFFAAFTLLGRSRARRADDPSIARRYVQFAGVIGLTLAAVYGALVIVMAHNQSAAEAMTAAMAEHLDVDSVEFAESVTGFREPGPIDVDGSLGEWTVDGKEHQCTGTMPSRTDVATAVAEKFALTTSSKAQAYAQGWLTDRIDITCTPA